MTVKRRSVETLKAAGQGVAAGYATSPLLVELYLHRSLAHDTYKMHPKLKSVCWLGARMLGFSPTTWSLKHRLHHSSADGSKAPRPAISAVLHVIGNGFSNGATAEKTLQDKSLHPHLQFPGCEDDDPVLRKNGDGLSLKFQNPLDETLSRHPLAEKLLPIGMIAAGAAYGRLRHNEKGVGPILRSSARVAGFIAGNFGPALIAAGYPEIRDGYPSASEAGRDMGNVAQAVYGSFALHRSHHEAPHLSEPPASNNFNRDRLVDRALQLLHLGAPKDGLAA